MAVFGWMRTSAPYGWFGSSADAVVLDGVGELAAVDREVAVVQRVDVVRAAGLDRVVQVGVDLAEQQQVLAAGVELGAGAS